MHQTEKNYLNPDRLVRMPEVLDLVGMSKASLYRMMARNEFVPRKQIGRRAVGFRMGDVLDWINSRQSIKSGEAVDLGETHSR